MHIDKDDDASTLLQSSLLHGVLPSVLTLLVVLERLLRTG
jgi:hypothetical protein